MKTLNDILAYVAEEINLDTHTVVAGKDVIYIIDEKNQTSETFEIPVFIHSIQPHAKVVASVHKAHGLSIKITLK